MTRLMVLGLLRNGPMSGYQMHQMLQMLQSDKWAGILPGSIYHALKKMEQEKFVEIASVEQTGNRSKAIYRITPSGEQEMKKLITESLSISSIAFPAPLYTGISFLAWIPADEAVAALDQQIAKITKDYEEMKYGEEQKQQEGDLPAIVRLSFDNMYDHYELHLSFLQKLKSEIVRKREED
ncbi:PadR family transcriptional regulator [Paenibacillus pinihumi]|uniref:PadR family transcriptional regulator n=1 Tax=Paenibacillus pinihumi TaxID=669462 RepID=UPI00040C8C1B|nr:PadR family transcriptional regulator [Paenibacillus pinihumi]